MKRSIFTKQRRQLSFADKRKKANQATRLLNHHFVARRCQHIGIYLDDFGELPTWALFLWAKKHGKSVYLPVVTNKKLMFRKAHTKHLTSNRLIKHRLGMKEPKKGHAMFVDKLDVLFLPLVACDKKGNRLGMGGGFYDRTLAKQHKHRIKKPLRIGWAYDFQLIDKLIAHPWDVRLNQVITPSQIYRHFC